MKPRQTLQGIPGVEHSLPGEELVEQGLSDLAAGIESDPALLVSIGAPRLSALGIDVPRPLPDAEIRLYRSLARSNSDAAHGRYNALVRRLVSYERAVACATSQTARG